MASRVTHPTTPNRSSETTAIDRLSDRCYRLGLLGAIGLLSFLDGYVSALEYTALFFLFSLLFFVPLVLSGFKYIIDLRTRRAGESDDRPEPRSWIESGYRFGPVRSLLSMATMLQPIVLFQTMLQWIGYAMIVGRYRGRLPTPEGHESDVDYRLPFDGTWTVLNGSPDKRYSHSWSIPQQRYAYDFVITDEDGTTHDGGTGPEAHYCFEEPVLAPAEGTVVAVRNEHRDYHRTTGWLDPLQYDLRGNYVTIKHDENKYSLLAHLEARSITVSPGEQVERGDQIGRCGHSGNSTEPHLHFQVQDRPNFFTGMSLPVIFTSVSSRLHDEEFTHRERSYVHAGQLVTQG
ncbi:M23 family metallopeptidase [Halostagnicola bangensis]